MMLLGAVQIRPKVKMVEFTVGLIMRHHGLRAVRTRTWKQMTLIFSSLRDSRLLLRVAWRGDRNSLSGRHGSSLDYEETKLAEPTLGSTPFRKASSS